MAAPPSFKPGSAFSALLKGGTKHISGPENGLLRNIDACRKLGDAVRTSLGPLGMHKMVITHLGKMIVTSDAATILRELEVEHPVAKLIVSAADAQKRECGDGTGLVVAFAAALLEEAEVLVRMGLHPSEIIEGYETALEIACKELEPLVVRSLANVRDEAAVVAALSPPLASSINGLEEILAPLVAQACISVLSPAGAFNVESVRVAKVPGGSVIEGSKLIRGAVLAGTGVESGVEKVEKAVVAAYTCDVDTSESETKGTVLLTSADQLMGYTRGEEDAMEAKIKSIVVDGGVNVILAPKFGEVALHYIDKYKAMAVACPSKFDLRRVAKTCGAVVLAKLDLPTREELGKCDAIVVEEIGSTPCVVFRQNNPAARVATILIRAATRNTLDDVDRAIENATNVFRCYLRDPRMLPGAGAAEAQLATHLAKHASTLPGLQQYAVGKFAEALKVVPRTLIENAGANSTDGVADLIAAHNRGDKNAGVNPEGGFYDAAEAGVFDSYYCKVWALRYATEAALTAMRVDQIIMAKTAGGPNPRDMMPGDYGDDAP